MRVLLPVNSAQDAKLMIDFVANYRWIRGTEFKVLHVLGANEDELHEVQAEHNAEALVNSIALKIGSLISGSEVMWEVVPGQPIYEILQAASQWKATMIVMGFRTRPTTHPYLAGSVSRGVAMQAPCSVSIIRPPEEYQFQHSKELEASA